MNTNIRKILSNEILSMECQKGKKESKRGNRRKAYNKNGQSTNIINRRTPYRFSRHDAEP